MSNRTPPAPAVGKHGFSGGCAPAVGAEVGPAGFSTFSLGIFEWQEKRGGRGLKRSKVKVRVSGSVGRPDSVYAKAREVCAALDAGSYDGPKTVKV